MVAAYLVEQSCAFLTGVVKIGTTKNKSTTRMRSTYLLQPRSGFYRVDDRVA